MGKIWNSHIHPSSGNCVENNAGLYSNSQGKLKMRGIRMGSRYRLCAEDEETSQHLIWDYGFNRILWDWIAGLFNVDSNFWNCKQAIEKIHSRSIYMQEAWRACELSRMGTIWKHINNCIFDEEEPSYKPVRNEQGSR